MPGTTADEPVSLILRGAALLESFGPDDSPILHRDAGLAVAAGRVAAIAPFVELAARHPGAQVVGDADTVVIPGLVNAHHHVGLTPLQLGSPDHPLELWFASRLALRDVDLRLDTLFSAFEMIASGVTTVQHLHSRAPGGPERILAAAQGVIGAYREVGMRASYSMALRDQNRLVYEDDAAFTARLPEALQPAMRDYFARFTLPLSEQVALFEDIRALAAGDPRIAVQVAPANLHWLSDAALGAAAELSAKHDLPMHMHLLETPYQKAYAKRRTGGSALAFLHRLGLTGPRLTIGHGVWMTEADIELCAHAGTRICHNCSSNLRLKSGTAPVNRFLAAGIPVALGMDEAGINDDRDMLQEMRLALRMHREPGIHAPHPSPAQVLRMATEHGAGTTPFGATIGRLSVGCHADAVLFDWPRVTRPWQSPDIPLVDVLVQRAKTDAVKTVLVGGEVVYRDGRFTRVDRDAVLAEIAARMARPLTAEEEARRDLARAVFPHVSAFYDGWLDGLGDDPHYRPSGRR
ncbi:amidohydrolase [Falsiroseomonas bella]|uniref:Amidohydrolase n=1 Tax=Falsiroseomonas bella TaxID=2184016 RepID=A0A317FLG9_9PROT|nr:amidohydrolase family protein [Falsiroseomonas bella]PWS38967.1 amidohydrolase [Falsiroseomonas bella]